MKKLFVILFIVVALVAVGISGVQAALYNLVDWGVNIDGTSSVPTLGDPVPAEVDMSLFNDVTGLGTLSVSLTGLGSHSVLSFFDHEIDEPTNTFFNEHGFTLGTPATGQSWEIDEPGFVYGDIFDNFDFFGVLDNSNGVPPEAPDDVSMAMGWDFVLGAGETAEIDFMLTAITFPAIIPSGLSLWHADSDSGIEGEGILFQSSLTITDGGTQSVPEPGTMLLLVTGLAGLVGFRKKFRSK